MRNAAVKQWLEVPARIEKVVHGLTDADLDRRSGEDQWSIREIAHHLVEANLVAATIIIAGVGKNGATYDWSWLYPNKAWMKAMGYDKIALEPAIEMLRALTQHVGAIVTANKDAMKRTVKLIDAPGEKPHATTVADVLRNEVKHANEHLAVAREIRKTKKRRES